MRVCLAGTVAHEPEALQAIRARVIAESAAFERMDTIVTGETTLEAAARVSNSGRFARIGVLNFASAKNPGGGFQNGAQAQEESLARSSGLYVSLLRCPQHYAFHRSQTTCLYSDRMIYSPNCPVFRTDDGTLRETPFTVDFLTSPAPNAGAIRRNEPENTHRILPALRERAALALALFADRSCDAIVLGAWGCGVFRNDPAQVADTFFLHLGPGGVFANRFASVTFAVYDTSTSQSTRAAFATRFSPSPDAAA